MNILLKGVAVLLAGGVLFSLNAAQFELTPTIGKKIYNKDNTLDDSEVLFGIRGTAYATENIALEATLESSLNNKTLGGGDTDIERGSLNLILEAPGAKVRPYLTGGIGYERTHGNTVKTTNDDSQAYYNGGIGMKFDINDNINLLTEVKGMHKIENGDNDVIATVGLGVKFGEKTEKKPTCETPAALSLDQFAKMCKTPQPPQPVVQIQQPDQNIQIQERVVVEENIPVAQTIPADNCVVELSDKPVLEEVQTEVETADIAQGYYVQMAALFKGNGELLTSKLERKNYPHVLYNTTRFGKDATLVLVGPYETRKEASVALKYLKRLSKKAFVKKFP